MAPGFGSGTGAQAHGESIEVSCETLVAVMDCRILRGHRGSVLALFGLDNLLLSGGRDNVVRCPQELYPNEFPKPVPV